MSELPEQPFVSKDGSEILGELLEHVVTGIVKIEHEEQTFASGTSTYTLLCGSPDIDDGSLIEVNRLWGVVDGSFYEFIENTDFTVDLTNNQITFITDPDNTTSFFTSYRYDQHLVSGITDISEGSVVRVLLQSVARQVAACWTSLELVKAAAYLESADGDDLDEVVKLVGVTRNEASGADGFVTFFRDSSSGQSLIPLGTQVAAQRTDRSIVYETTEDVYFQDGFASARAPIEAVSGYEGKQSNMGPEKITRLLGAAGGASRCNNPQYYSDYEFHQLLSGKYTYTLDYLPRRVINTEGFTGNTSPPWAETDKGVIGVWGFKDISMETASWTTSNVDITQDDPEDGQLLCTPSTTVSAFITREFETNLHTYPHVFMAVRGVEDDEFNVDVEVQSVTFNVEMHEFASTSSSTQPLANLNWTVYAGAIFRPIVDVLERTTVTPPAPDPGDRYIVATGATGTFGGNDDDIAEYNGSWGFTSPVTTNIAYASDETAFWYWNGSTWTAYAMATATFNIIFNSTNDYWVDFVGLGYELDEIQGSALNSEIECLVNYTAKTLGLWYVDENNNFFQKFDGDDSDGTVDDIFIYYQWNNNISGGGDEESDDALRLRGRNALQVAAKGTKEAIKNAVLDIDGISQCEVSDYNDDTTITPGVCHVFVLAQGFTVSPSLNEEIVNTVDAVRAAGVQVRIFSPQVRYANFTINVVYDDSLADYVGTTGQVTLRTLISSAMDDYFADASINDALYFSELFGFLIQEVRGVEAAYIAWDDATTPSISDDDYDGAYAYDVAVVLDNPQRITGFKTDATIVVQRGSGVTVSSINLLRKSEKR